ncbi:22307_t:CDS:2 [Dentiscutata erythropus]|uniref:22307_t:CDS:1 n=1 Tax=Dentiscutata erythropus TaxID=1348616 RepID=A0A9N9AM02_9GLOM|nr:22307_t:CDS:2 [Dentiscutata erythropus]
MKIEFGKNKEISGNTQQEKVQMPKEPIKKLENINLEDRCVEWTKKVNQFCMTIKPIVCTKSIVTHSSAKDTIRPSAHMAIEVQEIYVANTIEEETVDAANRYHYGIGLEGIDIEKVIRNGLTAELIENI